MTKFVLPLCSTTDRPLHHFPPLFLFLSSKSAKTNQVKDYNLKGEKEGVKKEKEKEKQFQMKNDLSSHPLLTLKRNPRSMLY